MPYDLLLLLLYIPSTFKYLVIILHEIVVRLCYIAINPILLIQAVAGIFLLPVMSVIASPIVLYWLYCAGGRSIILVVHDFTCPA